MKNLRTVILTAFLILGINASYSQFYDVKIKRTPRVVGTQREPTHPKIAENGEKGKKREPQDVNEPDNQADRKAEKMAASILGANSSEHVQKPLFCSPLDTLIVTSGYGYRKDPFSGKRKFHAGTDYRTASENVYAMMPGRIRKIGYDKKLGNFITLDHGDIQVTYAHLHMVVGSKGDSVEAGQSVGISGNTGRSTGEHLHVSIKFKKKPMDPHPIIKVVREYARLSYEKETDGSSDEQTALVGKQDE